MEEPMDDLTVCTEHLVFVPCRRCERDWRESRRDDAAWSADPSIVDVVRQYQNGDLDMATASARVKTLMEIWP